MISTLKIGDLEKVRGKRRLGENSQVSGGVTSELRPDVQRAVRGYKKVIAPKAKLKK